MGVCALSLTHILHTNKDTKIQRYNCNCLWPQHKDIRGIHTVIAMAVALKKILQLHIIIERGFIKFRKLWFIEIHRNMIFLTTTIEAAFCCNIKVCNVIAIMNASPIVATTAIWNYTLTSLPLPIFVKIKYDEFVSALN